MDFARLGLKAQTCSATRDVKCSSYGYTPPSPLSYLECLCELSKIATVRLTGGGVGLRKGAGSSVVVYLILRLSNHYPCLRRPGNFHITLIKKNSK